MNLKLQNIPFSPPDITQAEAQLVTEALLSGWITTGPKTKEFERQIAAFCHTDRAVCLNSATAAMEMTLRVLGIGPGDEVIVPAYTYTATASAALHVGATVRMIDSRQDNVEMDYDQLAQTINEHTKVIVPVDLGGIVCDYDRIYSIVQAKQALFRPANAIQSALNRCIVMADAAHAYGAMWHGQCCGEIADFTCFSFHAVKNLTTAEGGAATWRTIPGIDNEAIYHQYQLLSLHGQSKDALTKNQVGGWEYDIIGPWYKCNMTDIMAAIGLAQQQRYEGLLARRHAIIRQYTQAFEHLPVALPKHVQADSISSGHLYCIRMVGKTVQERNAVITQMAEQGIATNVHYKPLPMMSGYQALGFKIKDYPNAYHLFENEITLPLYSRLTDEQVAYIIQHFTHIISHG